jgi:hypothetical protein
LTGLRSALTGEGKRDEATALDARITQVFRYADRPDLLGMR